LLSMGLMVNAGWAVAFNNHVDKPAHREGSLTSYA